MWAVHVIKEHQLPRVKSFSRIKFGCRLCRIPLCKTEPCWQEHADRLNSKESSLIYNMYTKFDINRLHMQLPDWCARSTSKDAFIDARDTTVARNRPILFPTKPDGRPRHFGRRTAYVTRPINVLILLQLVRSDRGTLEAAQAVSEILFLIRFNLPSQAFTPAPGRWG